MWRDPAWLLAFLRGIPRADHAELEATERRACVPYLRRNEQRGPDYLRLNPQGLLPALELDSGRGVLTQSLAICEWLEETHPEPRLLPRDPITRAHIRAFALAIACDIHPLQNLKVLRRLRDLGHDQDAVNSWAHDVVVEFAAMPTLAEVCLVPQLINARRFGDLSVYPRLLAAERACRELPAFAAAAPELQPDAEPG
jgi:maleylpyruvate isomerase